MTREPIWVSMNKIFKNLESLIDKYMNGRGGIMEKDRETVIELDNFTLFTKQRDVHNEKLRLRREKMANKVYDNMVIYLLQLHMIVNGKNYLLKYVGQTVDFEKRKKQHIRDLKQNSVSGKHKMIVEYFMKELDLEEMPWEIINDIHKAIAENRYQFSIVHKAKTKKELNCAELAYMFMLDVNMNSFYSEANCTNKDCDICGNYMTYGLANNIDNGRMWLWPSKGTFTHDGLNRRRVWLRTKIKQERSQIEYYKKWKAGWLPKSVPKLWEDK